MQLIMGLRLHAVAVLSQTLQAIRSVPQLRISEGCRNHQAVLSYLGVSSHTDQFVGLFLIATHCISSIHLDHYDFSAWRTQDFRLTLNQSATD